MAELSLPKLSIEITADGSAAVKEIQNVGSAAQSTGGSAKTLATESENAGKSLNNLGTNAANTVSKVTSLQESMQKVGSSMTKTITAPIVAAFTAATKGAADLVETVSKTEVVFGDYYDQVDQWSQSSIENMGIARSTALEMASLYGDMATGMGFGQAAAADMATELTSLAADMASFKNISIDTAETALKSVFTGETESLKNLGIVMTETNLEAYALSQGITTSYSAMSQAEKVTLRYNYVMAQSKNAQGDFARTGDSLSNQFRKLVQTVKQLGEDLGTLLIPYVTKVVTALQNAVQWITDLDSGTKETILTIAAVVAAIGPLLLVGAKVLKLVTSIKAALAVSSLNPIILAITGAAAAAALLVSAFKSGSKEVDKTSESYQRAKSAIEKGIETKVDVDSEELDALDGKEVDITFGYKEASDSETEAWEAFSAAVDDWGVEPNKTLTALGKFTVTGASTDEINDYAEALVAAASATGDYSEAVDNLNSVLESEMRRQMQEIQTDASERIKNLAIIYNNGGMSLEDFEASVQEVVDGAKEATEALEAETEAKKKQNEVFANGKASDDAPELARQAAEIYSDSSVSWEDTQGYLAAIKQAKESGETMTDYATTGQGAIAGLGAKAIDVFNQMTQATDEYNAAMEEVTEKENEAAEAAEKAELARNVAQYMPDLDPFLTTNGETLSEGIDLFVENLGLAEEEAAAFKTVLTDLYSDENGVLPESAWDVYGQAGEKQAQLLTMAADWETEATTAAEAAATGAETAATAYQTSMQTIQDESGFTTEAMTGAMNAITETGATIPTTTEQLINATSTLLDTATSTLESGSDAAAESVSGMIENVSDKEGAAKKAGKPIGSGIIEGVITGIKSKNSALQTAVNAAMNKIPAWARKILGINSPSKVMRDLIGKNIMAGITAGIEDETTSTYSTLKSSLGKIVSGAQSVINRGSYSFPSAQLATSAGGMNYGALGEALSAAVQDAPVSLIIKDKVIAQTTSDATARNQTIRAQRINRGKGRW